MHLLASLNRGIYYPQAALVALQQVLPSAARIAAALFLLLAGPLSPLAAQGLRSVAHVKQTGQAWNTCWAMSARHG